MHKKLEAMTCINIRAFFLVIVAFSIVWNDARAQYAGINDDIATHRKGTLVVKARRGATVTVEQLGHEFWFGAAISNSLAGGRWSEAAPVELVLFRRFLLKLKKLCRLQSFLIIDHDGIPYIH